MKIKKNMICWLLTVVLTFCMAVTPAYASITSIYSVGGPNDIAVDSGGNIYIVTGGNSIAKINSSGALLATLRPTTDGQLYGVTVDTSGNIYVTDHKYKRVMKLNSSGTPTDYISMQLSDPYGLAVDGNGTIYVADIGLRKIVRRDSSHNVTKIGTLSQPYDVAVKSNERIYVADNGANNIKELGSVDGGLATAYTGFSHPTGIAVDGKGNIYVADTYNNVVKKIDTSHNITTIASALNMPWAVAVDNSGKYVYIGDTGNDVIKRVDQQITPAVTVTSSQKYTPYGTPVTLTATLPANANGTVNFVGAADFGTATVSNGTASCQTSSTIAAGKYYVRAMYSGDDFYNSVLSDYTQLYITKEIESATITGLAVKGETLTADLLPADAAATYIWKTSSSINGNYTVAGNGSSYKNKTYIPVNVDRNKYIKVEVTGSSYYTGSVTSEAIGPISYALEAPNITSKNATTFGVGTNGMFTVVADGGPKPTLSAEEATLPAGVTFTDNNNGTATLTGTPEAGTAGDYTFTITASNTVGTDALQEFTLTVTDSTQVAVMDVTLDNSTMSLKEGETGELNATVNPNDATNKNIIWSSDDKDVATVNSDGEVIAVAEGTAIITVTTEDGSKKATCIVTVTKDVVVVTEATLESITAPSEVIGVANATEKTADALGLPSTLTLVTDKGNFQASVAWEVDLCNYDPLDTGEQIFTVLGTVALPQGVINTNNVSLNVTAGITVNASASTNKTLVGITVPDAIIGVANATSKTGTALGLPLSVTLVTNDGNVQTGVIWDVDSCNYVQEYTTEQTFTVDGTAILPESVVNTNNVDLDVTISVTVNAVASTDKTLVSITPHGPITGLANETAKTNSALGLPLTLTLITDDGNVQTGVIWDVDSCGYDPLDTTQQTFVIEGIVALPEGVINTNNVDLNVTISVTVNAAVSTYKTLVSITPYAPITGLANATAKTNTALGLPLTLTLITDDGNVQTGVIWDVDSCGYDPLDTTQQTFVIEGIVALPEGVINTNNVDLNVTISVTVNAAVSTHKTLVSITQHAPITGLANATAKTNTALGLPLTLTLVTDDGNVQGNVTWNVDSCGYDPQATTQQTFTVDGTVALPEGVVNTNNVSLTTSISVSVKKHSSDGGSSSSWDDSSSDEGSYTADNSSSSATTATSSVTTTTDTNNIATASVTSTQIADMVEEAINRVGNENAQASIEIGVNADSNASGISVTIAQEAASSLEDRGINLMTISSPVVTLTFDRKALDEISKNANGDIEITAHKPDETTLSDEYKAIVGDRPVFDLKITSGETTISSFGGGTVTVSVPYTPAAGEDTSKIVVYYISGLGELIMVPNCIYDAVTGTVIFKTTHFSAYAIGYKDISFSDVSGEYEESINFLNAREIINGTGEGKFSPNTNITRAELVTILANFSGDDLSGYTTTSFKDVEANDWYLAAVEWAYENGVTAGFYGKFAPNTNISREQMAVMLYNYAKYAGLNVSNEAGMSIREFTDYDSISNWAAIPIQWAVNNSLISRNSDGSFAPATYATRAQAAKSIALLLQNIVQ